MSYDYQTNLKETVVFQSVSTNTVDERGLYNSDWTDEITTKCRIESNASMEEDGRREFETLDIAIFIPAGVNVKTSHRAVINSEYYDVLGIQVRKNRHNDPVIKVCALRKSK